METTTTTNKCRGLNTWCRRWRLFGLYFYISNVRMRKRQHRDIVNRGFAYDHVMNNKQKLYERQEHRCPHCGGEFAFEALELHHILPIARFPELRESIRNSILLCHRCHKEVHCNPWRNIQMMRAKADELGIDLTERYIIKDNSDEWVQAAEAELERLKKEYNYD